MVPAPGDDGEDANARPSASPFSRHVSRATDRFETLLPFAAVPFGLSVLEVEKLGRALDPAPGSFSINLELALPSPLLDLWGFVDPPPAGRGGSEPPVGSPSESLGRGPTDSTGGGPEITVETPFETVAMPLEALDVGLLGWFGTLFVVYAVLASGVSAAYLGGIDRRLRNEPAAPLACIVRYAPRFLVYHLLAFGAFAILAAVLVAAPPLLLLAIPAALAVGYLFYAAPFLFVVADDGVLEALRRSYGFALEGGPYLRFAGGHVVVAALASFALSVAVSVGPVGVVVALVGATALAVVLTAATVSFLRELVAAGGVGSEATGGVSP